MNLVERFDLMKKNMFISRHPAGSIDRIFEYYEKCGKHIDGKERVFIKPEVEEQKKKKSLN